MEAVVQIRRCRSRDRFTASPARVVVRGGRTRAAGDRRHPVLVIPTEGGTGARGCAAVRVIGIAIGSVGGEPLPVVWIRAELLVRVARGGAVDRIGQAVPDRIVAPRMDLTVEWSGARVIGTRELIQTVV